MGHRSPPHRVFFPFRRCLQLGFAWALCFRLFIRHATPDSPSFVPPSGVHIQPPFHFHGQLQTTPTSTLPPPPPFANISNILLMAACALYLPRLSGHARMLTSSLPLTSLCRHIGPLPYSVLSHPPDDSSSTSSSPTFPPYEAARKNRRANFNTKPTDIIQSLVQQLLYRGFDVGIGCS